MSYSRIKVWIAAEVLTASDLNSEHNGHISNENDLDTKLIAEVSTRSALETDYNTFCGACWNAGSGEIAANRVSKTSMKDDAIGLAEIEAAATDPAADVGGLRTLGTTAVKACAGTDSRLSDCRTPCDGSVTIGKLGAAAVTQANLKTSQSSVSTTNTTGAQLILPGGEYGFWPRLKSSTNGKTATFVADHTAVGTTSYASVIGLKTVSPATAYAQQRYITSSGEIHWVFILREKSTKQIISMYQAPDHPCFGNGGKPLFMPHPFGDYDETKHEIIVINPSLAEIEQMELETIIGDETEPDKDLLEIVAENYEIDENSNPAWPDIPVTVGLPKYIKDKKTGKKILADYRFMIPDTVIQPVKKIIHRPSYIKTKKLRKKI